MDQPGLIIQAPQEYNRGSFQYCSEQNQVTLHI